MRFFNVIPYALCININFASRIELYTTGVTVHVLEPGGFSTNVFNNEVIERERALQQAEKDVKKAYGWYFESGKYFQLAHKTVDRQWLEH